MYNYIRGGKHALQQISRSNYTQAIQLKWGYCFMSLSTRQKLRGFIWTELTITKEVVARVKELRK